jgi:hypothetical protein
MKSWMRAILGAGFVFFLVKGLVWLVIGWGLVAGIAGYKEAATE